jgi:Ulp1 family protease
MGIQCFAFTTQFITKLCSVTLPAKEDEFKKMMSRHYRSVSSDLFDVMIIPINIGNGRHWCIIVIDPRKQLIFFYDPLQRGVQRVTLL